jgi:GT2 family glycosyltransferase
MRIGMIEPHLWRYGGIRRMLEFANRLTARGHEVTFYLPDDAELRCTWMRCDARIAPVRAGFDDPLDVVMFTHEPQWHLVERFGAATRSVFYALHYGRAYGKEGSWESLRTPVDLQLANSNWTADQIAAEIGRRPTVQLGGVNRDVFRRYGGKKRYKVLCVGDARREWKGHDTVVAAGRLAGVKVEGYSKKNLGQPELGREYDAARVFAVGSWFEGFGQPGLEALACGTPLVTTDNGGSREYALDGETALVVPPRDAPAMAAAIRRVLEDPELAGKLSANGLDLVSREFDWEARTDELAEVLDGLVARPSAPPIPARPDPPPDPELSVVVLAWDNLVFTQQFVESIRRNTDVPYELVIVDNGSQWEAANYARVAADRSILNDENLGFARGMNQGLGAARGPYVAFCNNDTVLPEGWAGRLLESVRAHERAALAVPAVTAARNEQFVRERPGVEVAPVPPFSAPPPAIVYVMRSDVVRALGAWGEEFEIASGEDLDLCFKIWVNDLDIVYDQRVLVEHVSKGSASRLDDWERLWAANRQRFLDKWIGRAEVPNLGTCDPERFERNRDTARAAAEWMQRYFRTRDAQRRRPIRLARDRAQRLARKSWLAVRPHVPGKVSHTVSRGAQVARRAGARVRRGRAESSEW